jgi:hypothetical protein
MLCLPRRDGSHCDGANTGDDHRSRPRGSARLGDIRNYLYAHTKVCGNKWL